MQFTFRRCITLIFWGKFSVVQNNGVKVLNISTFKTPFAQAMNSSPPTPKPSRFTLRFIENGKSPYFM